MARQKKRTATPLSAVVKVIEHACSGEQNAIALYVWLVAITGVRCGELCAVQIRDIDLDAAVLHVAYNHVGKGGKKVRNQPALRRRFRSGQYRRPAWPLCRWRHLNTRATIPGSGSYRHL